MQVPCRRQRTRGPPSPVTQEGGWGRVGQRLMVRAEAGGEWKSHAADETGPLVPPSPVLTSHPSADAGGERPGQRGRTSSRVTLARSLRTWSTVRRSVSRRAGARGTAAAVRGTARQDTAPSCAQRRRSSGHTTGARRSVVVGVVAWMARRPVGGELVASWWGAARGATRGARRTPPRRTPPRRTSPPSRVVASPPPRRVVC
jgi:hypothetical protein